MGHMCRKDWVRQEDHVGDEATSRNAFADVEHVKIKVEAARGSQRISFRFGNASGPRSEQSPFIHLDKESSKREVR